MQPIRPIFAVLLACFLAVSAFTQSPPIVGKWQTKDRSILNFVPCGSAYCARYVATNTAKEGDGQLIARDVVPAKNNTFTGTVIDTDDNNKEYKATWTLSRPENVDAEREIRFYTIQ